MKTFVLLFVSAILMVGATRVNHDKKSFHGFHLLGNLPGFYANSEDTCHPKGHHHIQHFQHRNKQGQHVTLKYNVSYKPEFNFARIEGNIAGMSCTRSNTLVLVRYHNQADAIAFLKELDLAHVVSSFPPFICQDSNVVNLYVREHGLLSDNVTLYVGGEVVGPLDVFSHAHVDFESNMLDANFLPYMDDHHEEPANSTKQRKNKMKAQAPGDATSKKSSIDDFKANPFAYTAQQNQQRLNTRFTAMQADIDKLKGTLTANTVKNYDLPKKPSDARVSDPWTHRRSRRMNKQENMFGWFAAPNDINFAYKWQPVTPKGLQAALVKLEGDIDKKTLDGESLRAMADTTNVWEWTFTILGENAAEPKIISGPSTNKVNSAMKNFFGKVKDFFTITRGATESSLGMTLNFDIGVRLQPTLIFAVSYDGAKTPSLQKFDLALIFYYQVRFNFDITINAVTKADFSETIFSIEPVCVPIPLGYVSILVCPKTEIRLEMNYALEMELQQKNTLAMHGYKRYGWLTNTQSTPQVSQRTAEKNTEKDSWFLVVPSGYETYLGKTCNIKLPETFGGLKDNNGAAVTLNPFTSTLEACALACAKLDQCKAIAFDRDLTREWNSKCYMFPKDSSACEDSEAGALAVQFFPDNSKIVVAGGDKTIRIIDTRGTIIGSPWTNPGMDMVRSVAVSANGQYIASVSDDGNLRLWKVSTTAVVQTISLGSIGYTVVFSSDNKYIITGSEDRVVRVFSVPNLDVANPIATTPAATLTGHEGAVYGVDSFLDKSVTPNKLIIASGSADSKIKIWDFTTKTVIETYSILYSHDGPVRSVAFSPDGKYVISGSDDRTVRSWKRGATVNHEKTYTHGAAVLSVAYSVGGEYIIAGTANNMVMVWKVENKDTPWKVFSEHTGAVNSVAVSVTTSGTTKTTGNFIASASTEGRVALWDFIPLPPARTITTAVNPVQVGYTGTTILAMSESNVFPLGTTATAIAATTTPVFTYTPKSPIRAFALGGTKMVTVSDDKKVRVWDAANPATAPVSPATALLVGTPSAVAITKDGKVIATASQDSAKPSIQFWDASTATITETTPKATTDGQARCLSFFQDTTGTAPITFLASGGDDKQLKYWDVATKTVKKTLTGHSDVINSCAFSPNGKYVVTGSGTADKSIRIWDVYSAAGTEAPTKVLSGHTAAVTSVAFSPDGLYVVSGSADKTVRVWDVLTGSEVRQYTEHTAGVVSVAYSVDGKSILSAGSDNKIYERAFWLKEYIIPTTKPTVMVIGALSSGFTNTVVFMDKTGKLYPEDFEASAPWRYSAALTASMKLIFEQSLILGIGDPSANLLGITFGGPAVSLSFTLLFEGKISGAITGFTDKTKISKPSEWDAIDLTVSLQVSLDVGLALAIGLRIVGKTVTIYENTYTFANLWSWGGSDDPLFKMQVMVQKTSARRLGIPCPINMIYRIPLIKQWAQVAELVDTPANRKSKFYWPSTTCTAAPTLVTDRSCLNSQCPPRWTIPAPTRERRREVFALASSTTNSSAAGNASYYTAKSSDTFRGICDAEVFSYTTTFLFIDSHEVRVDILIDQGPVAGLESLESSCLVRAMYRVRGEWSDKVVELVHVPNPVFDVNKCWQQPIPPVFRAFVTNAGMRPGLWIYHASNYCGDQHLRYGGLESTLSSGESLINEQTMESAPAMAQLILHRDGNLVIYSYETDEVIWESQTAQTGNKVVNSALSLIDGVVTLETSVNGVTSRKILNPGSPAGGQFLTVYQCDLHLYPDSRRLPWTSLWNLTNKACPEVSGKRVGPKWHRGGSYLFRGESLMPNTGMANNNGMLEHERGLVHFVDGRTLETMWSLSDESVRGSRTSAFSMQWDGNLILVDYEGKIVWQSNTGGLGATVLRLEKCSIVLYKEYPNIGRVWSKGPSSDTCKDVLDFPPLAKSPPISAYPTPLNRMEPGQSLLPGQSILSAYGQVYHQIDGDVVILSRDNRTAPQPIWSTKTAGKCTVALAFQFDGALRLYGCDGTVVWDAGVTSTHPKLIEFTDTCTFNVYNQPVHSYVPTHITLARAVSSAACPSNVPVSDMNNYVDQAWLESGFPIVRTQTIATLLAALTLQPDGDLVFYALNPVRVLWRSKTSGQCVSAYDITQGDVVIYNCNGVAMWSLLGTGNTVKDAMYLSIDDYKLVLQNAYNDELWNSLGIQTLVITSQAPAPNGSPDAVSVTTLTWALFVAVILTCILCGFIIMFVYFRMKRQAFDIAKSGSLSEVNKFASSPTNNVWSPSNHQVPSGPEPGMEMNPLPNQFHGQMHR